MLDNGNSIIIQKIVFPYEKQLQNYSRKITFCADSKGSNFLSERNHFFCLLFWLNWD